MSEPEWMSHAACRGHWKEGDWDDLKPDSQLLVCSTCPVLDQCRADVDELTRRGCRPSGIVQAGQAYGLHLGSSIRVIRGAPVAPRPAPPRPAPRSDPPFDDSRKTCRHGHPWTRDTTEVHLDGTGRPSWACILCHRASGRASHAGRTLDQQLAIDALETA